MKLLRTACLAIAMAAALVGHVSRAFACTCLTVPLAQHFESAEAVFVGYPTIIRLGERRGSDPNRPGVYRFAIVKFQVKTWWKGGNNRAVVVRTGMGGGDCGSDFRVGRRYIVFASRHRGDLWTGICSGNMDYDPTSRDVLIQLEEMSKQWKRR